MSQSVRRSLHEQSRPRAPRAADRVAPSGRSHLVAIHDHLRQELVQIREAVEAVAAGAADAAAARSVINDLTMRQNYWSLGAFCAGYCRVLGIHHTIEDERMFADLRRADDGLGPVLDRLSEEHEVIAALLTDLDDAVVALVADPAALPGVRQAVDRLAEALLSHLTYEEEELVEPIERLGLLI
ncbi:hemerythrin domain-containing protein [Micromonospora zhanjiangensis]|uniref:Hemerythrin domain-containing protein n=1 Tax=Micromonospora zhanjiangensis TaxID=1522057 RepID=A0ABV8KN90_9ACTN